MSIQIDNGLIQATFDEKTGAWQSLLYVGDERAILHKTESPFDLTVDGQPFFGSRRVVSHVHRFNDDRAVALHFEQEGLSITHTIDLDADRPVLRQQVDVHCLDGRAPRLLSEVVYHLPGLVIGDPADCLYQAPGQSTPIDTPYATMATQCEVHTDGSYENGHITNQLNRGWLRMTNQPLMTAAQYRDYLVYSEAARPSGYLRANFTANHDMQAVAREARQNPLGNATSLVHAFAKGIPFVTWLEIEGREAFFAELMGHRAALNGYTCSYTAARTRAQDVFTSLWSKPGLPSVLAISNLSLARIETHIGLPQDSHTPQVIWGEGTSVQPSKQGIEVDLQDAGYALIRLE